MHKVFQEALDRAEGRTEYIVVVLADIRGFSEFSSHRESADTAMYIKRVYIRMIDDYFPGASFYKPTGDGMLITMHCSQTEESLRETARAAVAACLRCVDEFPNVCQGDRRINFEVPTRIGFGLARGTACCLVSGDLVLDYSGHLLNLTSRLTDLARPSGIVIDGEFGMELLSEDQQSLFEEDHVCIRSVAEEAPRTVYIQKGVVEIPDAARRPLRLEEWRTEQDERTVREWKVTARRYRIRLPRRLKRPDGIQVEVQHARFRQREEIPGGYHFRTVTFQYVLDAGRPFVELDIDDLLAYLRAKRLPGSANVKLVIRYVPE